MMNYFTFGGPVMMSVTMVLVGPGFTEPAGKFEVADSSLSALTVKFDEMIRLISTIRPEMHSVVFSVNGYTFTKTLEQFKMEDVERAKKEEGYKDSLGY